MTDPDFQLIPCEWLLVGFRVGRDEQFNLIDLCRRFDGAVIFRQGEVMVVELGAHPGVVDELLAKLPGKGVTHLWRSGRATISGAEATHRAINFCRV